MNNIYNSQAWKKWKCWFNILLLLSYIIILPNKRNSFIYYLYSECVRINP